MRVVVTGLLCFVGQGVRAQRFEQLIRRKLPGAALLLVLFACVATASAQMKAVFSRPMPTSAAVGLQKFLGSSAGAPLLAANPALLTVLGLDVSNPVHLQALGPLSARLPVDFAARAVADAGTARAVFSAAYSMSSNDAVGEIDSYARAAVMSAASDANAWRGLGSAASDLKSYSLYGEAARERVTLFAQKAATVRSQELAKSLSLQLLAGLRGPESAAGGIPVAAPDAGRDKFGSRLSPSSKSRSSAAQSVHNAIPAVERLPQQRRGEAEANPTPGVSPLVDLHDPEIAEFFKQRSLQLFDLEVHPSLKAELAEIVDIVSRFGGIEKLGKLQIAIADNVVPDAFFTKNSDDKSLIVVNIGLFRTIKNKDELAFVLGHEVSHGLSDLQTHIDQKYAPTGDKIRDRANESFKSFFQRPVENEVDVRSMRYVLDSGLNPHAGPRWLRRMQETIGGASGADGSHTTLQTRIDVLESALTYWQRVKGEAIPSDEPEHYTSGVTASLRENFIMNGGLIAHQLPLALQEVLSAKTKIESTDPKALVKYWHPYDVADLLWPAVEKYVQGLMTPEEYRDLKADFLVQVVGSFETAHAKAVKTIAVPPARAAQLAMSRNMPDHLTRTAFAYVNWTSPSVWLARFFEVGTLEDLPPRVRQMREERARRFESAQADFKVEYLKLALKRDKEFADFFEWIATLQFGGSYNSKDLIHVKAIFTPKEVTLIYKAWQYMVENPVRGRASLDAYDEYAMRLRQMPQWLDVDPVNATPYLIKAYAGYFTSAGDHPDRDMDKYFWALEADRFGPNVQAAAFADGSVRRAILEQFGRLAARLYKPDLQALFVPTEKIFGLITTTPLGLEKMAIQSISTKMMGPAMREYAGSFGVTAAQAEILVFLKLPKLYLMFQRSGLPTPSSDDVVAVIKSLPPTVVEKVGPFEYNSLIQLLPAFSPERRNEEIYGIHAQFDGNGISFGSNSFDVAAWHPRRTEKGMMGLDARDYSWVLQEKFRKFESWVEKNNPTDYRARLRAIQAEVHGGDESKRVNRIILDALDDFTLKYKTLSPAERTWRVFRETRTAFGPQWWGGRPSLGLFSEYMARHPDAGIDSVWGFIQATDDLFTPIPGNIVMNQNNDWVLYYALRYLANADLNAIKVEDLSLVVAKAFQGGQASKELDVIFENFWQRTEGRPDLREYFADPRNVNKLYFDNNKIMLARHIVENKFHGASMRAALRRGAGAIPPPSAARPEVVDIKDWLTAHFPDPSSVRDALINDVMDEFLTTSEETKLLAPLKAQGEAWYRSSKVALLDAPDFISRNLKSNAERLSLIEYLIGTSVEFEKRFKHGPEASGKENFFHEFLKNRQREFRESSAAVRAFTLQGLMGPPANGVLSDAATLDRVRRILLGSLIDQPEVAAIFDAYLDSVDGGQKKVILSHLLQSFVENSAHETRLSASSVFNSMGAFGAKSAQTFRTTGLGGARLQKELDSYFDHALPPTRDAIYRDLRDIFGADLGRIHGVRELVGSGSINYVVIAEIRNKLGRYKLVAVRIQKAGVVGQVQNENRIWESAVAKLARSGDKNASRTARTLEEVRRSVMSTLDENGVEFDLAAERGLYMKALKVYKRSPKGNEWAVEPIEPDMELQTLVPAAWSKRVSIYEFIDGVSIKDVADPELRRRLAAQIVNTELDAFFAHGLFDRDGHPGNWLVDQMRRRLVRLDYAQLAQVDDDFRKAFRTSLGVVLRGRMSSSDLLKLARTFRWIYDVGEDDKTLAGHLESIVASPDFPGAGRPHERYFFIRDGLESRLGKPVRFKTSATSALSLLARISLFSDSMGPRAFEWRLLAQLNWSEQANLVLDDLVGRVSRTLQSRRN